MYLTKDNLSIWEVAHRWHDADPNTSDPLNLPLPVQDSLRTLTKALAQDDLHVLNEHGVQYWNYWDIPKKHEYIPQALLKVTENVISAKENKYSSLSHVEMKLERMSYEEAGVSPDEIDEDEEYFNFMDNKLRHHREAVTDFDLCYDNRIYDKDKLESVFLDKYEIFQFCSERDIPPPEFWYTESDKNRLSEKNNEEKPVTQKQLRPSQLDRELCRAIAQTLWSIYPDTNIKKMCEHQAIKIYGNGNQYGVKTIRGWITDLDPRPPEQKTGRPKKKSTPKDE
jgi:hypothetical protein